MGTDDDFDDSDIRRAQAIQRRDRNDELDMAFSVCDSLRTAIAAKDDEMDAMRRGFAAQVRAYREQVHVLELANKRLREAAKGEK